ncbi:MAG TPA: efflux RND transporter periplasmic adaptor subunit [Polyangiales bacterium]|nr:efflux RND transporter periplasmic adaptor subunit [Polyangiales bacterium]
MLAALAWLFACHPQPAEEDDEKPAGPIAVKCEAAQTANISDRVELRGSIRPPPDREVVVSPIVAGRLLEIRVHEGDSVSKGQVLATVDDPSLAADATEAEASKAAASAAAQNAQSVLARAQRLFDQGIAARREVDEAKAATANTDAALRAAEARLTLATTRRSRASVTSPISGVVVKLSRAPGDLVDGTSQTPLAQIADPSVLELRADAPALALVRLRDQASVAIHLDALPERTLSGHVAMVSAAVDTQTGLGTVRIAIDKNDVPLKIGLAGRAEVQVGASAAAVVVPAGALRRSATGEDEVVVCAEKDGKHVAQARAVKAGAREADRVEVREGLKAGEPIVVDHALGLEDGAELDTKHEAASGARE